MEENTKRGIAIVTKLTNLAHEFSQTFNKEQLNQLLELFGQRPINDGREYVSPDRLVHSTYRVLYDKGDGKTAETLKEVFTWFIPEVDLSLLE
jgi:hypothetical protein